MEIIGIAILFLFLGILIKYGKMYFLIAGYNTLSKEDKARYNADGIATVFRNAMFGMAIIIIAGYFAGLCLNNPNIKLISLIAAITVGIPYLLIKANSKNHKTGK